MACGTALFHRGMLNIALRPQLLCKTIEHLAICDHEGMKILGCGCIALRYRYTNGDRGRACR